MQRHPNLTLKKAEHLQKARKNARDPFIVYVFYEKLKQLYESNNLMDPSKACFVFNCDESGFKSDPSKLRAIGEKGKPLERVSGGSGRESTTVLMCVSVVGGIVPPLIVFKGQMGVQARWVSELCYPGTKFSTSKNGWMEEPLFYNWIKDIFIPFVKTVRDEQNLPEQRVVLIYDGHSSHISIRIVEEALNERIDLFRLPSHLTDKIQPLDKSVFGPVKIEWDKKLVEFGKKQMGKGPGRLPKDKFGEILGKVIKTAVTKKNIVNGFITTGIFPVDDTKFKVDLFDPNDLQRYKNAKRRNEMNRALVSIEPVPGTSAPLSPPAVLSKIRRLEKTPVKFITGSTCNTTPEIDEVALDLSTIIRRSTPEKVEAVSKSIVEIFSNVIRKHNEEPQPSTSNNKPISRLRHTQYGEVLTATEVLTRMKETQQNKENKNLKNNKKDNSNKRKCVQKKKKDEEEFESENESAEKDINDSLVKDSDDETEADYILDVEIENTDVVSYELPTPDELVPGTYILVDFLGACLGNSSGSDRS